ncbi:tail completion/neck protein [Yersinia phage vB_YenM_P778]
MVKRIQHAGRDTLLGVTKALAASTVKVGYSQDDGIHQDSGMTYAELMYLQEVKGVRSKDGLVRRRAFEVTSRMHSKQIINKLQKKIVQQYRSGNRDASFSLDVFGEELKDKIKRTMGDPSLLPSNAPITIKLKGGRNQPLVDTGALKDKLSYRVTAK